MTKLAALQKVLQSDFLASVREVYEHVYETVDIQGSQVRNISLFYFKSLLWGQILFDALTYIIFFLDRMFVHQQQPRLLLLHSPLVKVMLIQEWLNCLKPKKVLDLM